MQPLGPNTSDPSQILIPVKLVLSGDVRIPFSFFLLQPYLICLFICVLRNTRFLSYKAKLYWHTLKKK